MALVAVVALAGAACGADGDRGSEPAVATPDTAGDAADGELGAIQLDRADGTTKTVADLLDGRPSVVNFFASWCPPCRGELPDFQAVFTDVGDDVNFVGIALQDSTQAAAELLGITGVTYQWALDPDGELYVALGGFVMPTTVYLSPAGDVLAGDSGAITEAQLRDRLRDLFDVAS